MPSASHLQHSGCLQLRRLVELEPSFVSQVASLDCLLLPFSQAAHGCFHGHRVAAVSGSRVLKTHETHPSVWHIPLMRPWGELDSASEEKPELGAQGEQVLSLVWSQDDGGKSAISPCPIQ